MRADKPQYKANGPAHGRPVGKTMTSRANYMPPIAPENIDVSDSKLAGASTAVAPP